MTTTQKQTKAPAMSVSDIFKAVRDELDGVTPSNPDIKLVTFADIKK